MNDIDSVPPFTKPSPRNFVIISETYAVRNYQLARWTRPVGPAELALYELQRAVGAEAWRVLQDGSVWVGSETWPELELEHDIIEHDIAANRVTLAVDALTARPGARLGDWRIDHVVHTFASPRTRTQITYQLEEGPRISGRLTDPALVALQDARRRIDRTALYPARVVTQAADLTLEVRLDDQRFPSMTKLPIRTPVPGATVKVANGARVLVGWEGADPGRPYAALWEGGTLNEFQIDAATKVVVVVPSLLLGAADADKGVARNGDSVQVTIPTGTFLVSATGGVLNGMPVVVDGQITSASATVKAAD